MSSDLIYTPDADSALAALLRRLDFDRLLLLTDTATRRLCLPQLPSLSSYPVLAVEPGERSKSVETAEIVWQSMCSEGLTRRSLLVNLGGGMITDLGGFAAAVYMRGIRFINVSTTLLAAVDASVGGKTGVNLCGVKNLVGAFHTPEATVISPQFLATLPAREILSGFGEMLKHALLSGEEQLRRLVCFDPLAATLSVGEPDTPLPPADAALWLELLRENIEVKKRYVEADPLEKGIRKALNAGHTIGHALESFSMAHDPRPISHGEAVARGLCFELDLQQDFPAELRDAVREKVETLYGPARRYTPAQTEELLSYMAHDKKNPAADRLTFTLFDTPGHVRIDCELPRAAIAKALQS